MSDQDACHSCKKAFTYIPEYFDYGESPSPGEDDVYEGEDGWYYCEDCIAGKIELTEVLARS